MAYTLAVRREAEADIASTVMWYIANHPGREVRFAAALDDCFKFILRSPLGPAKFHRYYRQFPLRSFPYFVVYMVDGSEVTVLRVFHMKRDPRTKLPGRRRG
jgi:toxin ParE1/3/4